MIKIFEDAFTVAVAKKEGFDIRKAKETVFHIIKNGWTYWIADPFPIEVDGELYIFAEMWRYRYLKGCIAYTKLTPNGFQKWKPVIEEKFHLSYPNIFRQDGKIYICPEANESGEIFLYECINFPEKWKKTKTLYQGGRYCDTTFYRSPNGIFGFTYQLHQENFDELKLAKIENGKMEISEGKIETLGEDMIRPGGNILKVGAKEFRVVQIGVPTYGSGLLFSEFWIDWPNFKEKKVLSLYPKDLCWDKKKNYSGIHTLNETEHYVVIDLKWNRVNAIELFWKSIRKIKKILKKL